MKKTLEYKGYSGSVEVSLEDDCLHGKILFITDLITYESGTPSGLESEFIAAVDDYIETCREIGKTPEPPFKGSYNVRITPELHKKAATVAAQQNISLNELTAKAIENYVNKAERPICVERHDHHHHHYVEKNILGRFSEPFFAPGDNEWTFSPKAASK